MKYLKQEDPERAWILDIETDGLQPTCIWVVVVKNLKTGEVLSFRDKGEFNDWNASTGKRSFIGHNILSYDIPVLNRLWGSDILLVDCCDTLVLSYLYNPAIQDGHSLDAWGQRLGKKKGSFSDWSQYSEEMLSYCIQDVEVTYELYNQLTKRMLSVGYSEKSAEIEHKIRIILDQQQRNGFWFDKEAALRFLGELRSKQADLSEQIQRLFPRRRAEVARHTFRRTKDGSPYASYERHLQKYHDVVLNNEETEYVCYDLIPFNLGSPKQRVERLLELGWGPEKFTETGFPKVDEDALLLFSEQSGRKEVSALAEWLVLQGRSSMIETWLKNLHPDSRIHGRVNSCGATTRRCTHSAPNTANIPSGAKAKYGHEARALWGVEPNKGLVLVGYDAAGLETAGLCHYLNNPKATEVLLRSKPNDIHTANARRLTEALGWECDREWAAKTGWYAWLYGAYPPKLGSIVGANKHGKSEQETGEIVIDTFFRNVPGLKELISSVQREWKASKGRLRCVDGGSVICPSQNAALNYLIQSAGTIVCKLAAIILDEEARRQGIDFLKVGDIHDEGQLQCRQEDGDRLGMLAVDSIRRAGLELGFRVPLGGDYKIGTNWSMTH